MLTGVMGVSAVALPPSARAQMASASSGGTGVLAGTGGGGASARPMK